MVGAVSVFTNKCANLNFSFTSKHPRQLSDSLKMIEQAYLPIRFDEKQVKVA